MATLYRRPGRKNWYWKGMVDGRIYRESTMEVGKKKASAFMERRLRELRGEEHPKSPKILLLDIETAPAEVYVWHYRQRYIDPISQVVKNKKGLPKDWSILTYAAKWMFSDEIYSGMVSLEEAMERDDFSIMKNLWGLFEESDIIVAHNGDRFDIRRCNYRFAINNYGPPSPFQSIDTMKVAMKAWSVPSYKLDYLNRDFGLQRKTDTDFELWERCVSGDQSGLDEMLDYNKNDIFALEELYLKVRPWIRVPGINLSMYVDNDKPYCPNCLSAEIKTLSKPYRTPAGEYEAYRCMKCGTIMRNRYTSKTLSERRNSYLQTAR